jgi:predicted transcriptional regulator
MGRKAKPPTEKLSEMAYFRVNRATAQQLNAAAKAEHRTIAAVIRRAIAEYLQRYNFFSKGAA